MSQYPQGIYPEVIRLSNATMDKYERRRLRLIEVRDRLCGGGVSTLAKRIGKSDSYVSRMLYEDGKSGRKRIGEDMVEHIENGFGWERGTFDSDLPVAELAKPGAPVSTDQIGHQLSDTDNTETPQKFTHPLPLTHAVGESKNFRRVYVVGRAQGGLPERIWTDGDHLVGAIDEYAELATTDPQAFICPVVGDSMYPRFMPGEYVLVEPSTPPQIEGTVLVRLGTGETMLKRLLSRRDAHVRLGSWNDPVVHTFRDSEITWMYYVAHAVPPEKIKTRF
ncbi:S24 family peptidase [Caballeronia glebae]|uniref:S24 family peptidase n=1 Tax=Caballeronia glebae TaxID=1777143 RepID=UPI0038BC7F96